MQVFFSSCLPLLTVAANAEMRFLFVKKVFSEKKMNKKWKQINTAGLILGLISSFGLLLVGCFQV
jgi:hypothetical protein